jgi:hypothetical protein
MQRIANVASNQDVQGFLPPFKAAANWGTIQMGCRGGVALPIGQGNPAPTRHLSTEMKHILPIPQDQRQVDVCWPFAHDDGVRIGHHSISAVGGRHRQGVGAHV